MRITILWFFGCSLSYSSRGVGRCRVRGRGSETRLKSVVEYRRFALLALCLCLILSFLCLGCWAPKPVAGVGVFLLAPLLLSQRLKQPDPFFERDGWAGRWVWAG